MNRLLYEVAKVLELQLQHQSFWWLFRTDFLQNGLVLSPCSPRDSQESSPTPQLKSINSSALNLLYGSTLMSVHDYWNNHSFDYTDICQQSDVCISHLSWWIIGSCSLSQHPSFLFIQRCLLYVLFWVIFSPFISEKLCTSRCVGKTIFPSLIRLYFIGQAVLRVGIIYSWVLLLFFVDRSWAFSGPPEYGQNPLKLYMGFHWWHALWVMTSIIIWIICLISGILHARILAAQPV